MDLYKKFSSDVIKRTELIRSLQSIDKNRRDVRQARETQELKDLGIEIGGDSDSDDAKEVKSYKSSKKSTSTSVTSSDQAKFLAQRSIETRRYRAEQMDNLMAGRVKLRDFLDDNKMLDMKLSQIFTSFPRMTREKSILLLTEAGINPKRRLRGLTTEQFNDLGYVIQNKYPAFMIYL
jgi:hypothetical protein